MSEEFKSEIRRRWSVDVGGSNYVAYDLDNHTFQVGGISYYALTFEQMDMITAFVAAVRKELNRANQEKE